MNDIITIKGIACYEGQGTVYLNLENVARGLGFTQEKNGFEYVRWETVNGYLRDLGFPNKLGKDDYIPENIFYRLAMKAKNEVAERFQALIADEVIPSIRKTGQYRLPSLDENIRSTSMRAEAMLLNAKSRQADLWNKFADKLDSKEHKQICASYGTEVLAGHRVIPLPEVDKTYSASEVGKLLGISANTVGRIANQNGLKTKEYGYYALDKSAHSNKEVEVFRYNERGVEAVKSHM